MKRFALILLTLSLLLSLLCVGAHAENDPQPEEAQTEEETAAPEDGADTPAGEEESEEEDPALRGSAAAVVEMALSQLDYEEAADGYTKYGTPYGYPTGHWCDMFVCWCAEKFGVPESVFPISVNCTKHVQMFTELERYHISPARGGDYVPRQGDLIFFYDYRSFPEGEQLRHVGLVLCVENGEVFSVEGNTLTNRLDYDYYGSVYPKRKFRIERDDYVAVKRYALDDPQIHGYASPDYGDTTPMIPGEFVDLGKYADRRDIFNTLVGEGIMSATSVYTFSPRYGMTRADFVAAVMKVFDFPADVSGGAFSDVPQDSAYYGAVTTARAMGLVDCGEDGRFYPDRYVSGGDAQAILVRAMICAGMDELASEFTEGDFSYLLTPYTIRADLARALYTVQLARQRDTLPVPPPEEAPSK